MRNLFAALAMTIGLIPCADAAEAEAATPAQPAPARETRAVMTGEQVVEILDETVDWYRTLGTQQQSATQPSDLLILYANRQTADKVMALAFEIARANAELLSSEAGAARADEEADASKQSFGRLQKKLSEQRATIQKEMDAVQRQLAAAPKKGKADLQARLPVLQGERDMINARKNLLDTMAQFASENDAEGFDANALKTHIDAIAASVPAASLNAPAAGPVTAAGSHSPVLGSAGDSASDKPGIWGLLANVLRLSSKIRTIEAIDRRTAELQNVFTRIRVRPLDQMKALATRSDALATQSAGASGAALKTIRDQYDTLAWLFRQTASILTPLSKEDVLLKQYRHNLANWRDATEKQYHDALKTLAWRLAVLAALLVIVFGAAELWRRAVFRYVPEVRRQYRYLLLRKIVLWSLIVAIIGSTFASELGSLVTFAGLITAGLAVAMQSVLVSVVGYFFLIGKYGIRVGDRVQIGNVTGEVIDLGLVRMHLMEVSTVGPLGPTGRVVAFANSIVFQASGGLFKQIPGVNLAWHEITLSLPLGIDSAAVKEQLAAAVTKVTSDYREDIVRQAREIQKSAASAAAADLQPQIQLRFSATGIEALVRYPVHLAHAAEIDERVSQEVSNIVANLTAGSARLTASPAS